MNTCLMVTGGDADINQLNQIYSDYEFDYILGVDKGMDVLYEANIIPNALLGDFDSCNQNVLDFFKKKGVMWKSYPSKKDLTDTHIAFEHLATLLISNVIVLGGIGTRMDHTLSTIMVSSKYVENYNITIINKFNRLHIVNKQIIIKKSEYNYLSVIPLTEIVSGVTITGVAYPVNNITFSRMDSYGISNELVEEEAIIQITNGVLLVIESRD